MLEIRNTLAEWNSTKEKLPSGPQITRIHADASRTVFICVNLRNLWASPSSCFKRLMFYGKSEIRPISNSVLYGRPRR